MAPGLLPGDWLLVDPDAYRATAPGVGDLVLAMSDAGLIVKRVAAVTADGTVHLIGDAPSVGGHGHDAVVPRAAVAGRPWFRYWPITRVGRLR